MYYTHFAFALVHYPLGLNKFIREMHFRLVLEGGLPCFRVGTQKQLAPATNVEEDHGPVAPHGSFQADIVNFAHDHAQKIGHFILLVSNTPCPL